MSSRRLILYGGAVILGVFLGSLLFLWRINGLSAAWNHQALKGAEPTEALEPLDPLFPQPDKTRYTMSLSLDVDRMSLTGQSRITTINTSGKKLGQLWLAAYPNIFRHPNTTPIPLNNYAGNFVPGYIEFTHAVVNGKPAVIGNQNVSVQLDLEESIAKEAAITIELNWKLHLPPVAYRLGYQQGVFMLGNFYPYLQVYNRQGWHHPPEVKFGDPFCQAAADYTVAITLPGGYEVVAGAELKNRMSDSRGNETWVFTSDKARDFALAAFLPGYQKEVRMVGETEIQVWGQSSTVKETADQAAAVLSYYQQIFTPYPRPQLKLVEVPMEGFMGMEYDGLLFLSHRAMDPNYSKEQRSRLVAHEIAHQWWYGLVGNDQALEPWLDEGLASWSARLFARHQGERVSASGNSSRQLNWPLAAFVSREQYMDAVYDGGDWFWQQLEKKVGHERLLKGLNFYLEEYSGQVASTGDMFSALMRAGVDEKVLYDCWQQR